jgi:hypothetical protein
MTGRDAILHVCLIGLLITAPTYAAAQEVMARGDPYWPSERAERLEEIGERVKDMLQQSSRAGYFGRLEEQEQILRQMMELQREAERLREAPVQSSAVQ